MRFPRVMPALLIGSSLLVGSYGVPAPASADVTVSLRDDRYSPYRTGMEQYFRVPEDQILMMSERGMSPNEVTLALFVANRARVSPSQVLDMRRDGMSWNNIMRRLRLSPEMFYVPVDNYSGPYESIYRHPRNQWDQMSFSDDDYVNLANLKYLTDNYGYEPSRVIQLRSEGRDFMTIANLIGNILGAATQDRNDYRYSGYDDSRYSGYRDSVGVGDVLAPFLYSMIDYFGRPQRDVYMLRDRGISDYDIPVVLYLSSRANVDPFSIADLRRRGLSWYDITQRYRLGSDIYYVPVDYDVYGGIYGPAYEMFRRQPRSSWRNLRLSDSDIANLVNLRVASEEYGVPPREVIDMRTKGTDFAQIHRRFRENEPRNMSREERQKRNSEAAAARDARQRDQQTQMDMKQQRNSEAAARRETRMREQEMDQQTQMRRNSEAAARRDARLRDQNAAQESQKRKNADAAARRDARVREENVDSRTQQQRNSEAAARRDARVREQDNADQQQQRKNSEAAARRDQKQEQQKDGEKGKGKKSGKKKNG